MTISLPPETSSPPRLQPSGWLRYFSFSVDHKVIGLQYLVCGFVFYLIGGALAGAIRTELTSPVSDFMARDVYNQVLTLHGTVMIFLWIVPVVNGAFGNYLILVLCFAFGIKCCHLCINFGIEHCKETK